MTGVVAATDKEEDHALGGGEGGTGADAERSLPGFTEMTLPRETAAATDFIAKRRLRRPDRRQTANL